MSVVKIDHDKDSLLLERPHRLLCLNTTLLQPLLAFLKQPRTSKTAAAPDRGTKTKEQSESRRRKGRALAQAAHD